jgi:hypothetical protein
MIYRKIHATGFYLNRLCRRLPNDEPIDPPLKAAKADARRYSEIEPEVAKICDMGLPPISIQAHKAARHLPRIGRRVERLIRSKCNAEIKKAIRRVEKTRAHLCLCNDLEAENQSRRIFQRNTERLDRELKQAVARGDQVARHWPMRWTHGVYSPIATPHEWLPKRKKPTLDEIEADGRVGWARLWADLGMPHDQRGSRLLAAEKREQRAHKMINVLVRRQARRNDPRLTGIYGSDSFGLNMVQ